MRSSGFQSAPASRTQSFTCAADLLRAFEHRAFELGCSFDWLLEEAMQRLLAESHPLENVEAANDDATAVLMLPAPPPPRTRAPSMFEEPLVLHYDNDLVVVDRHPFVIGRSPSMADLVIESSEVSRRHAAIEHTTDGWVITDLGSTNGIIVNGVSTRSAVLAPGVVMSIGPMTFAVA